MIRSVWRCIVFLSLAATLGFAENYKVVSLKVVGAGVLSEEEIADASGLRVGQASAIPGDLQKAVERLGATGAFENVRYSYRGEGEGVSVEIDVKEAAEWAPCDFDNFPWASSEELQKYLADGVVFYHGKVAISDVMLQAVVERMQQHLREKNLSGEIELRKIGGLNDSAVSHVFVHVNGVPVTVVEMKVSGAPRLSAQQTAELQSLLVNKPYDKTVAESVASASLPKYYGPFGMLRAKATCSSRVLSMQQGKVDVALEFSVDEGSVYSVSAYVWSGVEALPTAEVSAIAMPPLGLPADTTKLVPLARAIESVGQRHGYLRGNLVPRPSFDEEKHLVRYELAYVSGPQYRFGVLEIKGLDDARIDQLKSLWALKEGEVFNLEYLNLFLQQTVKIHRNMPVRNEFVETAEGEMSLVLEFVDKR